MRVHLRLQESRGMIAFANANANKGMHQKMVFSRYNSRDKLPRMVSHRPLNMSQLNSQKIKGAQLFLAERPYFFSAKGRIMQVLHYQRHASM
jgi:hypothetical protein